MAFDRNLTPAEQLNTTRGDVAVMGSRGYDQGEPVNRRGKLIFFISFSDSISILTIYANNHRNCCKSSIGQFYPQS